MSPKHSRGDWSSDGPYIVCMPPNRKHDIYLAEIVSDDELGRFEKDSEKRAANAQLMAAAPRLLSALEAYRTAVQNVIDNWSRGDLAAAINALENLRDNEAHEAIEAATS